MEIKLNPEEVSVLKEVLKHMKIRKRTGELGIMHGSDRFVSTNNAFKKHHLAILDQTAKKIGLTNGVTRTDN